jgi:hypothetical protein
VTNALATAAAGGPTDTAAKNIGVQTLIGMLRLLAGWVQIKCNNDMATLLASGFQATSTNRASVVLSKPKSFTADNGTAGQLVGKVTPPVANCNMYEGRATPEGGTAMPSVFTGDSQHIYFNDCVPGTMYKLEARCLGGAAPGYSDWSDPTSHRAM